MTRRVLPPSGCKISWAYPPYKPSTSLVLDVERFNENMAAFAQETDGNLNEHNFEQDFLDDRIDAAVASGLSGFVADDVALKLYHSAYTSSPLGHTLGGKVLRYSTEWSLVEGAITTFSVPAGKLFIVVSFQYHVDTSAFTVRCPGAVFCIELDGAAQMNSLIGTGDQSNEYTLNEDVQTPSLNYDGSPSFRSKYEPLQVKGTYAVSAGQHTVKLVHRNLSTFPNSADIFQWISQVEVMVIWMWA